MGKQGTGKQKRKQHAKDDARLRVEGTASPPAEFAVRVFERIQAEASGRFERIVGESHQEMETFTGALAEMLTDAQAAARQRIDEITADIRDVHDRCALLREAADRDRAAAHAVLVSAQAVAKDLEIHARRQAEGIASRGNASLAQLEKTLAEARISATTRARAEVDRAEAEVTTLLEAAQLAIDEQLQPFREQVAGEMARSAAENSTDDSTRDEVDEAADGTPDDPIWGDLARATFTSDAELDDDENFFGRLAAELRADADEGVHAQDQVLETDGHGPR